MTKQQLLEKLSSSEELVKMAYVPVSEVINWVNELENETLSLDSDLIDKISTQVADQFNYKGVGLVDDYELEMNYREVEISSIVFDTSYIEEIVRDVLDNLIKE